MNPLIILWNGSLLFLAFVLAVICFPFSLALSCLTAGSVALAKYRRRRRETQYSWAPTMNHRSAYRRRRHGWFA